MTTTLRICLVTPGGLGTPKGMLVPERLTCTPFSHAAGSSPFATRTMTGLLLLATPCFQPTALARTPVPWLDMCTSFSSPSFGLVPVA